MEWNEEAFTGLCAASGTMRSVTSPSGVCKSSWLQANSKDERWELQRSATATTEAGMGPEQEGNAASVPY